MLQFVHLNQASNNWLLPYPTLQDLDKKEISDANQNYRTKNRIYMAESSGI